MILEPVQALTGRQAGPALIRLSPANAPNANAWY